MLKWLKMGCGHLVALPLLLVGLLTAALFSGTLSGSGLQHQTDLLVTGGVTLLTWGLAISLLAYLWLRVWPAPPAESSRTEPASGGGSSDPESPNGPLPSDESSADPGSFYAFAQSALEQLATSTHDAQTDVTESGYLPEDERPWETRPEWTTPQITTDRGTHATSTGGPGQILFGALFVAVGGGLTWSLLSLPDPSYAWILGLVFLFAGLWLMGQNVYQLLRKRRYGTTTFEMDTFPAALGGPLCGTLHTGVRASAAPDDGFQVLLSCYRRRVTRDSDGDRSVARTLLWRDEKKIVGRLAGDKKTLDVPLTFEVPAEGPPSTAAKSENRILWTVEATADVSGIDYATVVEIPVFPVRPDESVSLNRYTRYEKTFDRDRPVSRGLTLRRPSGADLDVVFGRGRRPGIATLLTVLGLGITGLGGLVLMEGSLFGGLLLLLLGGVVDWGAYYYWTYRSRVTVTRAGIQVEAGTAGRCMIVQFPCSALQEIRLDVAGGAEYVMTVCYAVAPSPPDSARASETASPTPQVEVVAARLLTNLREAKWIAVQIEEAAARHGRYE